MKKIPFILLLTFSLITGALFFIALPKAEREIQNAFKNIGFKHTQIENITLTLVGLKAKNIVLGKDGFNKIDQLEARIFWPLYIFNNTIKSITIQKLQILSVTEEIQSLLFHSKKFKSAEIASLPINEINIKHAVWDISSNQGAIRIEGSALIKTEKTEKEETKKKIIANITASQHQLSFSSQWSGTLNKKNAPNIHGTFEGLRINYGPFHMARGTGWLSYTGEQNNKDNNVAQLSGQIEAGNGALFGIPSKNINLLIGQEEDHYPIIFRAHASGIKGVTLTADAHLSEKTDKNTFNASLNIHDLSKFGNYLAALNPKKKINDAAFNKTKELSIFLNFLEDRRFAGGPLPFEIQTIRNIKDSEKGTFLIYPDTLDIRGTVKIQPALLPIMRSLLSLPSDNISGGVIRLDGNLKSVFGNFNQK